MLNEFALKMNFAAMLEYIIKPSPIKYYDSLNNNSSPSISEEIERNQELTRCDEERNTSLEQYRLGLQYMDTYDNYILYSVPHER